MTNGAWAKILKDIDPRKIDALRQRLEDKRRVLIGYPSGATEEDGTPVALVAATHEFGAPSRNVPERPTLRPGIQRKFPQMVRLNKINLIRVLRGQMSLKDALGQLGAMAVGAVKEEIDKGSHAPLKASTIARRRAKRSPGYNAKLDKAAAKSGGSVDRPLIDTGQMRQSVTYVIEGEDGS